MVLRWVTELTCFGPEGPSLLLQRSGSSSLVGQFELTDCSNSELVNASSFLAVMQPMYSLCIPKEILVSGRDFQLLVGEVFFLNNNKLHMSAD